MTKTLTTKLPTIQDLYSEKFDIVKQTKLNIILNHAPKEEWVKTHPFVKGLKYIPIERVEYLLTNIFSKWNVEVKTVQLIANSVVVTVRLYVQNPITGEMDYQDGIGAAPIQVSKGSKATQFENMNSSAIQIGAPAAESYAIKDAAEKFGKIFGKDLNRKDIIAYTDTLTNSMNKTKGSLSAIITNQLKKLGINIDDKEVVKTKIKGMTGLDVVEDNYIEITNRLSVLIAEQNA